MENLQFQVVHNLKVNDKVCDELTLYKGLKSERMRLLVEPIRAHIKNGNKEAADQLKKQLPAIMTSGLFSGRTSADLVKYSGIVTLDLDKVPEEQAPFIKDRVALEPYTRMTFTSPGGCGVKILVAVDSRPENHREACKQVAAYYAEILKVTFDEKTTDIARLTFMSYDPEVYYYPDSDVFHVAVNDTPVIHAVPTNKVGATDSSAIYQRAYRLTVKKYGVYVEGKRNEFIYRLAGYCNLLGLAKETLLPMLSWSELPEAEKRSTINSAYNKVEKHGTWRLHRRSTEYPSLDNGANLPNGLQHTHIHSSVNEPASDTDSGRLELPTLPTEVYDLLPRFFKGITGHFSHAIEKDIVLVSAIGVLSSAFPNVKGLYDRSKVGLNMYVFFVAPPSAGKGLMKWSWVLGSKIQNYLKDEFHKEYTAYLKNGDSEAPEPRKRSFYISTNSSKAALFTQMESNQDFGVMYDNEGDTLSQMFKNDWSNSSDILRKAFHHEPLSQERKNKIDCREIEKPKLSVVLSGTPSQIPRLVDSISDGLFSRFLFLYFNYELVWKDKFSSEGESLEPVFNEAAKEVLRMWKAAEGSEETLIVVSEMQRREINAYFSSRLEEFYHEHGEAIVPNVYRTCLIWYRIAMQLTTVRAYESANCLPERLTIDDRDYRAAFLIVDTLLEHLKVVFRDIMKQGAGKVKGKKQLLIEKLPSEKFEKSTYLKVVESLGIKQPMGEKWLKDLQTEGKIVKIDHGWYQKAA